MWYSPGQGLRLMADEKKTATAILIPAFNIRTNKRETRMSIDLSDIEFFQDDSPIALKISSVPFKLDLVLTD